MDFDKSYISGLEFLVPTGSAHVVISSLFIVLHSVVSGLLISSIGDPYRAVIEELTNEAAKNGTVLTVEEIRSTDENPLPSEMAPNPVFVIGLIVSIGLHVLFFLAQRWSVNLRIKLQYKRLNGVRDKPSSVCVYPPEFRGKPEIVPLVPSVASDGSRSYRFDFQRRKFEIHHDIPSRVELLSYPLKRPINQFVSENNGIDSSEVARRQSMYGMNMVDIPVPPFYKLYLEQLLSPIPIFQLFCSALWMMDEYWKYTLFTLLTIFGFEVSTTVQRKKSLETLRSMSGKVVVPVLAKRNGPNFIQITSDQLVPGDRIRFLPNTTVVPCDCLIVSGSAVVNEASLTGESIPQMKDAIDSSDDGRVLDISDRDKVHCLFAGTTLIRSDANSLELIVLRTGSQSSQGELLRMVEFSQQQVSSDKKDTMWLLLLLLVFAIAAASYVVYERVSGTGSENLTKMKTHKLVLRVIMIITSVVPPELPLQMSLAVNTALMALHKIGIFCTEPFRVPMAGSVTHCFFDKTGTLTSDKLECHGLSTKDSLMTQMVAAGCHSLIEVEGKILGDPVEQTALEYIGWRFFANENRSVSPDGKHELKIMHRFHFSSQLQRMSCIVTDGKGKSWAVVKGSPEVIFERLVNQDKGRIEELNREYEDLAHAGKRVLALGYKYLKNSNNVHRDDAESDLEFAGFASFGCETRADTLTVINALSLSAELPCVMVTGDALLTAVHVAKDTGILTDRNILRLEKDPLDIDKFVWRGVSTESQRRLVPFVPGTTAKLASEFGLVVSGSDLPLAPTEGRETSPIWSDAVPYIRVFARMSPSQKEQVIALIRSRGGHPLMCGDGGNDVGALKQADVGVALLAGFGSANTQSVPSSAMGDEDPEDQLEKDARIVALKEKRLAAKMKAEFEVKKKALLAKQQEWMNEELARPGNSGYWSAIKSVTARLREELAKETKLIQAKYGAAAWDRKNNTGNLMDKLKENSENDRGGAPVVQMGDASVAAPFTSRAPSIRSVVQIIRQGRCTLLVAVQMMQIMMLESLISAYTFAAITMEGGRSTEIQLIGSSMFVMVASIAFTYAKPNKKLSNVIPLKSVFSPAIFFSVVAQVLIHLGVLVYAMSWAKTEMGPESLQSLYDFERERDEKLTKLMNESPDTSNDENWLLNLTGGMDMLNMFKSVPYRPNLLNTVMFLVKTSQQVSVLVVNYKGSPWMQGALENKALFLSMFACAIGIVVCSTGYIPWVNQTLELMVLPTHLRDKLLLLLAMSTVGTFVIDRLIVLVFAREIFFASTFRPMMTTSIADFLPILKTCGYIAAGVLVLPLVLGNPIGMIAGFYGFKMYKKWKEDREMAELDATELAKQKSE